MKKWLIVALLAAGAVGLMRLADRRRVEGSSRPTIWDKLGAQMEEMPEDFPPRVMFDNVAETNETTKRIVELLEKGDHSVEEEAELVTAAHDGQGAKD
ncbi:MAG: hypothetical protein OEM22_08585 [Acidimicrobiia bacterium]|nr:hypothetical protein [Acidimicrobiia bacterium]MDH3471171.1 hypothetical protein [Acidimicrobiia bacterium]